MLEYQARLDGFMAVHNGQRVRWLPNGRMLAVKSNLDFTLIGPKGFVCFVDCKSFVGSAFTYSQLDKRQVSLGLSYTQRGISAGFLVYLRAADAVVFYPATLVAARGPRSRFDASNGQVLGSFSHFELGLMMG